MRTSTDICIHFISGMTSNVRLRFAPSPTGPLHIGGIRTAFYNYLFAKKYQGQFILRIEDTDQGRYVEGAETYIVDCLKWLGLLPDEGPNFGGAYGPYRQSERKEIYLQYAQLLIERNEAYYAFDTSEALEQLRSRDSGNHKYDFITRMGMQNSIVLDKDQTDDLISKNVPFVIRLKVPANVQVRIDDIIRGEVHFNTADLDDKVLIKSDGMPTYHMANVIDDYLMQISHVIRGEEWLSSTAHHVLLYKAFGWEEKMPKFAHLPLILKPTGNGKLSKRDGAQFGFPVFPIAWTTENSEPLIGFKEYGFEPDALLNFLALLGWNSGSEQELFTVNELIKEFSLEKIVKSGARFDFDKAKWFNQQYLHRIPLEESVLRIKKLFQENSISVSDRQASDIYDLFKDRVLFFHDYYTFGKTYFLDLEYYDIEFLDKKFKAEYLPILQSVAGLLEHADPWDASHLEILLKDFIKSHSIKPGDLFPTLRVVISGIPTGPDVFKMLAFLGSKKTNERLINFINYVNYKKII